MTAGATGAIFRNVPVVSAEIGEMQEGAGRGEKAKTHTDVIKLASTTDAASGRMATYSSRKVLLLETIEKDTPYVSIPERRRDRKSSGGGRRSQTCVVEVRRLDELGPHRLVILAVLVLGHQLVHAVVDVGGVDQLQAAVVLALGGLVDPGADVFLLLQELVPAVPLQVGLGVALHAEGDAPVVVPLRLQELLDGGGD